MPRPDYRSQEAQVSRLKGRKAVEQRQRRLAAEPLCRHCKEAGRITPAVTPDHIVPLAKGGTDDDSNIQCLCTDCHDAKTREDFGYRVKWRAGRDGRPTDPAHPWNRRA